MSSITLIATSVAGLESEVAFEVRSLGYAPRIDGVGRVVFNADFGAIARCNLWLRCAERLLWHVGAFDVPTFDDLYENVRALPWREIIPPDGAFPVDGNSVRSRLSSVPAIQRVSKKAVVDALTRGRAKQLPETGATYRIRVSLLNDRATVTIDTSGTGLHKRGYRAATVEAPLKETLAAGLVRLCRWKGSTPFTDPMCGSGTIAIEAALIATGRAPGRRRSFAAECWPAVIPARLWQEARREADDSVRSIPRGLLTASDRDRAAYDALQANLACAGLDSIIATSRSPMESFSSAAQYGSMVTNPPYGERLGSDEEIRIMIRSLGTLMETLPSWSFYVLTSWSTFEQDLGRKASKRRKLYNGTTRCDLYQYHGPRPPRGR